MEDRIQQSVSYIRSRANIKQELGIVLGTGLNSLAERVKETVEIPYGEIPGFKVSTAPSHKGRLVIGRVGNKRVVMMQGRLHYYEGYSLPEITYPIRVLTALGINTLILTNAAGSLNPYLLPGDLVAINDHINFMGNNPLIGANEEQFGERFPSLHDTYDAELRGQLRQIADRNNFKLREGVYIAVTGPSFETRAECLMMRNWGADLVGMSTVPEVIAAIHGGLRVIGLSAVTNFTNIFHGAAHTQAEIQEQAAGNTAKLEAIIKEIELNS
ncbi:MAG: purine-nucleoside phosphorylase [Candidatus Cloacimonetes bacterium]|nr:purine-nucleoside phosphorylase [Candidatus Cloacimonadota bacterium]